MSIILGITYRLHCTPKCVLYSYWMPRIGVVEEHLGGSEYLWTQC